MTHVCSQLFLFQETIETVTSWSLASSVTTLMSSFW